METEPLAFLLNSQDHLCVICVVNIGAVLSGASYSWVTNCKQVLGDGTDKEQFKSPDETNKVYVPQRQ